MAKSNKVTHTNQENESMNAPETVQPGGMGHSATEKEDNAEAVAVATAKRPVLAGFKVAKVITVPLLKFVIDQPIYVKFTGEIFLGKETKGAGETAKMEAAHLCNVINLETGEEQQIIVAKVLHSVLEEEYKDHSYVGKCFELTKGAKGSGKRYNPYSVVELTPA